MGDSPEAESVVGTMDTKNDTEQAVDILQQLGLKEYEANCYVGLSRVEDATAKELAEITDVPRTRVYDAIRVLEAKGLVEIQHSNPQRFRAVPQGEAIGTLRDQFDARVDALSDSISNLESVERDRESITQEVWALSGSDAIANRTEQLIGESREEVVLVVGEESLVTDDLIETLNAVPDSVTLHVGVLTESLERRVEAEVPHAEVYVSGLDWLRGSDDRTAMGRLLLVDRETILTSSYSPETREEQAVFGSGFGNGLVVIARRLMETGLLPINAPRS